MERIFQGGILLSQQTMCWIEIPGFEMRIFWRMQGKPLPSGNIFNRVKPKILLKVSILKLEDISLKVNLNSIYLQKVPEVLLREDPEIEWKM